MAGGYINFKNVYLYITNVTINKIYSESESESEELSQCNFSTIHYLTLNSYFPLTLTHYIEIIVISLNNLITITLFIISINIINPFEIKYISDSPPSPYLRNTITRTCDWSTVLQTDFKGMVTIWAPKNGNMLAHK